jgi:beta-1,4-mannosyltransferase
VRRPERRPIRVEAEPAFRTRRANPYNARLYEAMDTADVDVRDLSWLRLLLRRVDVVHLHWPSLTFLSGHRASLMVARLVLFYSILRIARLRGTRLIWTAHNVDEHEQRGHAVVRRAHRRLLTANVDSVIVLTESGIASTRAAFPELARVPMCVVPHGHYRADYDFELDRADARRALDLPQDAAILVSVGQIRAYKGVPQLVRTFRETSASDAVLVVAGRPADQRLELEVREAAAGDPRVRLLLEFQSHEKLARLLVAGDAVVLGYSAVQNSGSAILALSASRPVLAPRIGALPDLQAVVGQEWLDLYEGDLTAAVLATAIRSARRAPSGVPDLSAFEWPVIAEQTQAVYRDALVSKRPRRRRTNHR